jgi:D-amino-acid dehydrogenase
MRVIVVGAGIVGASAAYHLAKRGVPTTLVDARLRGAATPAGAGIVFPWPFPGDPAPDFALQAAERLPALMRDLADDGLPTGYARTGGMSVGTDTDALDAEYGMLADLARRPGYTGLGEVARLERGEPARRFPVLPEDTAGVWVPGMARLDGARTAAALVDAAEQCGARRAAGDAALIGGASGVTGVRVGGTDLPADAVIVAAGAWTAPLLAPLGVRVPVYPMRGQIVHAALPGRATRDWPAVRFAGGTHYMLAFPPDRVVLSGTREPDAGFDARATVGGVARVLADAVGLAPGLEGATVAETRVGLRPAARDGRQILGTPAGLPGVVVATGLGANGLTLGPYQGAVAARLALGEDPGCDLAPFHPDRPVPAE